MNKNKRKMVPEDSEEQEHIDVKRLRRSSSANMVARGGQKEADPDHGHPLLAFVRRPDSAAFREFYYAAAARGEDTARGEGTRNKLVHKELRVKHNGTKVISDGSSTTSTALVPPAPSASARPTIRTDDDPSKQRKYFDAYAMHLAQKNMLTDYVRTECFRLALRQTPLARETIANKTLMDFGAGTGILGFLALMDRRSGEDAAPAYKVYAVEASGMARTLEALAKANGFLHSRETCRQTEFFLDTVFRMLGSCPTGSFLEWKREAFAASVVRREKEKRGSEPLWLEDEGRWTGGGAVDAEAAVLTGEDADSPEDEVDDLDLLLQQRATHVARLEEAFHADMREWDAALQRAVVARLVELGLEIDNYGRAEREARQNLVRFLATTLAQKMKNAGEKVVWEEEFLAKRLTLLYDAEVWEEARAAVADMLKAPVGFNSQTVAPASGGHLGLEVPGRRGPPTSESTPSTDAVVVLEDKDEKELSSRKAEGRVLVSQTARKAVLELEKQLTKPDTEADRLRQAWIFAQDGDADAEAEERYELHKKELALVLRLLHRWGDLVSECIGTCLVNERMFECFLTARDRFLLPLHGATLPCTSRICVAPYADASLYATLCAETEWWSEPSGNTFAFPYGLDLSCVERLHLAEVMRTPVCDIFRPEGVVLRSNIGQPKNVEDHLHLPGNSRAPMHDLNIWEKHFDWGSATHEDLEKIEVHFRFRVPEVDEDSEKIRSKMEDDSDIDIEAEYDIIYPEDLAHHLDHDLGNHSGAVEPLLDPSSGPIGAPTSSPCTRGGAQLQGEDMLAKVASPADQSKAKAKATASSRKIAIIGEQDEQDDEDDKGCDKARPALPCMIHGVVVWFDCGLGGVELSTSPWNQATHWRQMFFPFPDVLELGENEEAVGKLVLTMSQRDHSYR
eukprot:g14451.t1